MNGILSTSTFVGNSLLSLVVALQDGSMAGGVSSMFKTLLITFTLPKIHLTEFGIKNLPVRYFSL